jgi:acyl-CoA reductase-like NAD-dependent aldehyde dehydrogenase
LKQVDNLEESFDVINSGPKPLAAYLFTNNKKLKERFVKSVSAGGLVINDTTLHVIFIYLLYSILESLSLCSSVCNFYMRTKQLLDY